MGRYPIFMDAIKNCLNNWHTIQSGKGNYLIQLINQNEDGSNIESKH